MNDMENRVHLAKRLAEYGIDGAGIDPIPEQQEWAADCVESAIYLLLADGWKEHYELDLGYAKWTISEMRDKARQMRERAERLYAEEKAMVW